MELERDEDGIDRRGFLKCMAWASTGVLWSLKGGILQGTSLNQLNTTNIAITKQSDFSFVQISDSHIGFSKAANPDVTRTLIEAVGKFKGLTSAPDFLIHTGDLTHLSKPDEFDTVDQVLKGAIQQSFYVPGEHDVLNDDGQEYLRRYGRGTLGAGWQSFDHRGVHFVGLVNVVNLKAGGMGLLGQDQLEWLRRDLAPLSTSTPIVVFAHIPLWTVYPQWGWGTDDSAQALSLLRRFGSVTVLNGHIHQVLQKVEGNVTFHTAASTAFPQPKPGGAPAPGPMTVDAGALRNFLGITTVNFLAKDRSLAVIDSTLVRSEAANTITIDNFSFSPAALTVKLGTEVTWVNHDDIPHNIVSADGKFPKSKVLDTDDRFIHVFKHPGAYRYYCGIHPHMTGTVIVK